MKDGGKNDPRFVAVILLHLSLSKIGIGGLLLILALAEIARALARQFTLVLLPLAGLCRMLAFLGLAGTLARALAKGEPPRPKAP